MHNSKGGLAQGHRNVQLHLSIYVDMITYDCRDLTTYLGKLC